jgi:predicted esterase
MLMYRIYVRAQFSRLQPQKQFVLLQGFSSGTPIALALLAVSLPFHAALALLGLADQSTLLGGGGA